MKPYGSDDIGLTRIGNEAGVPRKSAAKAIAVFCLAAVLMNGVAMRDSVALKPYGTARRVWLTVMEPLAAVSARTRLAWLRQTLEAWLHE